MTAKKTAKPVNPEPTLLAMKHTPASVALWIQDRGQDMKKTVEKAFEGEEVRLRLILEEGSEHGLLECLICGSRDLSSIYVRMTPEGTFEVSSDIWLDHLPPKAQTRTRLRGKSHHFESTGKDLNAALARFRAKVLASGYFERRVYRILSDSSETVKRLEEMKEQWTASLAKMAKGDKA